MSIINELANQKISLTYGHILEILKEVCDKGDIMIIKGDGIRETDKYSVIITSGTNKFLSIRFDDNDLLNGILKAIEKYYQYISH